MNPATPAQRDFGTHFEQTIAAAAAGDLSAKPLAFFLPTSPAVDTRLASIRLKIHAARMEQVDAWVRREMVKHLGADVCARPADAFADALLERGIYGKEMAFAGDEPGVMRFALMGRVENGPDDIIATMTYEPTFELPKPNPVE